MCLWWREGNARAVAAAALVYKRPHMRAAGFSVQYLWWRARRGTGASFIKHNVRPLGQGFNLGRVCDACVEERRRRRLRCGGCDCVVRIGHCHGASVKYPNSVRMYLWLNVYVIHIYVKYSGSSIRKCVCIYFSLPTRQCSLWQLVMVS